MLFFVSSTRQILEQILAHFPLSFHHQLEQLIAFLALAVFS